MGKLVKLYRDQTPVDKAGGPIYASIRHGETQDKVCLRIKDDYAMRTQAVFAGYELRLTFAEARKIARVLSEYLETKARSEAGADLKEG